MLQKLHFYGVFTYRSVVRIAKRTKIHRYKILIPICKFNYLDIVTADGRKRCITFNREKQLDEAMIAIRSVCKRETL